MPARNGRATILKQLSPAGGALNVSTFSGAPEAAMSLVDNWQDKEVVLNEENLLACHLCFHGRPVARVIISRFKGKVISAHIYLFPNEKDPASIHDFGKTILEQMEGFGLKYT